MTKLYIVMQKECRYVFNNIKLMGLNNDGIIFGGMVRDEIIATHYKALFDEHHKGEINNKNYKKFWNINYHPETAKRTLIPNDIDIYFENIEKSEVFIQSIKTYAESFHGSINISNSILYEFGENLIHKKIHIIFYIGKTFIYSGKILSLSIDVIINNSAEHIEPPFNNGDFTCNLFVMSKSSHNNYDIRLSKNTGTKLDVMSHVMKINLQSKIMNDLISGSTEFIRKSVSNDAEYINGLRIIKMIHKNIKISNILFREIPESTNDDNICDICQMSTKREGDNKGVYIELLTNKHAVNIMHKPCFYRYLRDEVYKKNRNDSTYAIECRCTRRNLFNFKDSWKFSSVF